MPSPKSKLKSGATSKRSKAASASRTRPTKPAKASETKHDLVLTMLRRPTGTTIKTIMAATKWQQHSVRGFLAGVVRKKLRLNLVSDVTDKGRIYKITDAKAFPAGKAASRPGA